MIRPLLLLVGLLLAAAAPAQTIDVAQTNIRHDEDWSVLTAAAADQRTGWRAAKYIPLSDDGAIWLSTGVEARMRHEGFDDNQWGDPPASDDGYLWLRLMPHADLHAGPVRAFVQGIGGFARGVGSGKGPSDETGIDLLQGFAELRLPVGDGDGITLRGGRELIALGSERLVGLRYGPNIPQAFDGTHAIIETGIARIDALALRPVAVGPGDFDDRTSKLKRLSGIYATLSPAHDVHVDLYWLGYRNRAARFAQGAGRETRQTYGLRLFGRRGGLGWNWEAMLQRGHFAGGRIRAWSIASETSYALPALRFQPRLRLRANIASGDGHAADNRLGTFNALFPKGKYFGELSPIGPQNIMNVHPSVDLDLGHGVTAEVSGLAYWRESRQDGLYNVPGQLIRAPGAAAARFIGSQIEAVVGWQPSPILSFGLSLSAFRPGAFIRQTGPARTIHMVGWEAMVKI
jgi:hypothetical protein